MNAPISLTPATKVEQPERQRRLDEFAHAAMQSMLLAPGQLGDECRCDSDKCARRAFDQAEDMLAESDRRAAIAQAAP